MSAVLSDVVLFGCTAASISWLIIQPASLLNWEAFVSLEPPHNGGGSTLLTGSFSLRTWKRTSKFNRLLKPSQTSRQSWRSFFRSEQGCAPLDRHTLAAFLHPSSLWHDVGRTRSTVRISVSPASLSPPLRGPERGIAARSPPRWSGGSGRPAPRASCPSNACHHRPRVVPPSKSIDTCSLTRADRRG